MQALKLLQRIRNYKFLMYNFFKEKRKCSGPPLLVADAALVVRYDFNLLIDSEIVYNKNNDVR